VGHSLFRKHFAAWAFRVAAGTGGGRCSSPHESKVWSLTGKWKHCPGARQGFGLAANSSLAECEASALSPQLCRGLVLCRELRVNL